MEMIPYYISAYLWWSPFRWMFEPLVRRLLNGADEIQVGPLHGRKFNGGLAQMLGIYEISIQKEIMRHLPYGGVFYDIGANNGFFTLFASSHLGVDGAVYAFEPLPENAESIRNVIRQNDLLNCHLEECAIADFVGDAKLYFGNSIATPSIDHKDGTDTSSLSVRTTTLNSFTSIHPAPDLIKLDVEGAELAVLRGAESVIRAHKRPVWIIEIHRPTDEETLYSLLKPGNYLVRKLSKPGRQDGHFPIHIIASPNEK